MSDDVSMRKEKIIAAKRLVTNLTSEIDFEIWLDQHPNTESAIKKLENDLGQCNSKVRHISTTHGTVDAG